MKGKYSRQDSNLQYQRFELCAFAVSPRERKNFSILFNDRSQVANQKSKIILVDREGFKPSLEVCKTSMLSDYITNPKIWYRRRDLHPHEPFAHKVLDLARLLIPTLRHEKNWYRRRDSNSHKLVSKTSVFAI